MSASVDSLIDSIVASLAHLKGERVIAAMSGGVDSSVMAALLKEAGLDVVGVFLNVWEYARDEVAGHGSCCSLEDNYDARRVADAVGIPFYAMDMRDTFRHDVIEPFVDDYEHGRTPNPCERCNRFVKFGALLKAADQLGAHYVATGHYVRRIDDVHGVHLFKGNDARKDQSYFLATTGRDQVARILFPVGDIDKDDTRRLAHHYQLPTAEKHESQDICFIPNGDRIAFLKAEGATRGFMAGNIVDRSGNLLGRHHGVAYFTLGQRKGLGLADGPWHVVGLDAEKALVIVEHPEEAVIHQVEVSQLSWIRKPEDGEAITAKVRYQMQPAACSVKMVGEGLSIRFDSPQKPTAPGQVAALYSGDELLGGGIVSQVA